MKNNLPFFLKSTFVFLFSQIAYSTCAQKLPNIQPASLRAPENVKIDGKTNEWGDQYQASNSNTQLSYSIANDDNNLYLIVRAIDPDVSNKIYNGGLTFSIDRSGKKNEKDAMTIIYPAYSGTEKFRVMLSNKPVIDPKKPATIAKADSFMRANNTLLATKAKYIRVAGIKDVDTLISIYNDDGIKAASQFNNQMFYIAEIALSLNKLGLSITDGATFSYHVSLMPLRGYQNWDNMEVRYVTRPNGQIIPAISNGGRNGYIINLMNSMTDFWGNYTLIKK